MSRDAQTIVWFRNIGRGDVATAGGKGANLGEMTRAGIPVPPGFVVTTAAYRRFLVETGLERALAERLKALDVDDGGTLDLISAECRRAIETAEMPRALKREIADAYNELGGGPVAVRSSATAEDLEEASFAGQQSTFLNIVGPQAVTESVQRCWASLFEARAMYYREQNGWGHMDVDLAVPVQRMVQSQAAGVMFTVDPITGDPNRVIIEAAFGLGEAVVGGMVTPDHFEVDKVRAQVLQRELATQDKMLVRGPAPDSSNPNIWQPLTQFEGRRAKLSDAEIIELMHIGTEIERHYGAPQDIEWGLADGEFYLLQTRPVTTIDSKSADRDIGAPPPQADAPILSGAPASPGIAAGRIHFIQDVSDAAEIEEGDVLVAEMTTPDFVPAMKRAAAIVTAKGGRTCHAAIISRELGVPCIVGAAGATELPPRAEVTVDAVSGSVYEGRLDQLLDWWKQATADSDEARIDTKTKIYVNLAEPEIADRVAGRHVDGVGLLRAEFIIARIGEHPRTFFESGRQREYIDRLAQGIRKIAGEFAPRPVVYRATDFKTNEYANLAGGDRHEPHEENPMIGYRGAARYVNEPELFQLELQAIAEIRQQLPNLHLMIPFVRTPAELRGVLKEIADFGLKRSPDFQIWMMVEVPSNVILLDEFIDEGIDGVSIGSNDLTQLTLGIDRDSERLADSFDERDPAVLRSIESVIETANRRGITVSICGQGPSEHPDLAERLVSCGITSISVTPDVIERTRRLVGDAEARVLG